MRKLLVSVRSVSEAKAALAGGAGLVDVKDPARGSLGRPRARMIQAVVNLVKGKTAVSAAFGELAERPDCPLIPGLHYAKWGLAGFGKTGFWQRQLSAARERVGQALPSCGLVAVAYGDWRQANAPEPEEICTFACAERFPVFLLDTWNKDHKTLLDWIPVDRVRALVRRCRLAGVRVALAGRLGLREIEALQEVKPDWFAVRSVVCRGGDRGQMVCKDKVRALANLVDGISAAPGAKVESAYAQTGRCRDEVGVDESLQACLSPRKMGR